MLRELALSLEELSVGAEEEEEAKSVLSRSMTESVLLKEGKGELSAV